MNHLYKLICLFLVSISVACAGLSGPLEGLASEVPKALHCGPEDVAAKAVIVDVLMSAEEPLVELRKMFDEHKKQAPATAIRDAACVMLAAHNDLAAVANTTEEARKAYEHAQRALDELGI